MMKPQINADERRWKTRTRIAGCGPRKNIASAALKFAYGRYVGNDLNRRVE
jgi:hypothetical protein